MPWFSHSQRNQGHRDVRECAQSSPVVKNRPTPGSQCSLAFLVEADEHGLFTQEGHIVQEEMEAQTQQGAATVTLAEALMARPSPLHRMSVVTLVMVSLRGAVTVSTHFTRAGWPEEAKHLSRAHRGAAGMQVHRTTPVRGQAAPSSEAATTTQAG